jgi:aspartyl-tRNA(Asn)/glutamyl-tRNA(Gln) amidotransferase subunit A
MPEPQIALEIPVRMMPAMTTPLGGTSDMKKSAEAEGTATAWSRRRFLNVAAGAAAALSAGSAFGAVGESGDHGDLAALSLQKVSEMLRRKSVSPVELTQEILKRIERLNPTLNVFITVDADGAMAQARAAEAELMRGKWRGALHGVPLALKDNIDTAGIRTTAASGVFANRVPTTDAEVVRRLKGAGAVLLGKLNMHEFAFGGTSITSYFGAVHNPWNPNYTTGGSSGGPAAAVAAGLCYGSLGTDTAGSVRIPGCFCDVVGFKGTYGLVSNRGVIPMRPSLDHVGPLTRNVADSALLLQPLAGYDPEDVTSANVPVPDFAAEMHAHRGALRLGVPRMFFYDSLDPDVSKAVEQALVVLNQLGNRAQDVQLPEVTSLPTGPTGAEVYAFHAQYMAKSPELYQPDTLARLRPTADVSAASYFEARQSIERLRREVQKVFASVDLVVTPTTPIPAHTLAVADREEHETIVNKQLSQLTRNTIPFDVYGLPTITVPCGFSHDGMPIGLQISGPPWGEGRVLQLAAAYEQATDWNRRPPTW